MQVRISVWISLLFCLAGNTVVGQISAPKFSNEFMNLGVGARGFAMSGAVIGSSSKSQSSYWNPSNMIGLEDDYAVSAMHSEFFAGIASYDFLSVTTSIDEKSAIGLSLIRFAVDDIPDTRFLYDVNGALNYDNIRFFSAADYGIFLSYAKQVGKEKPLNIGGSVKIIHRLAGNFARAWGFGIDLSGTYTIRKWRIAAVARDLTGTFNAWTHNSALLIDAFQSTGNEVPKNSVEVTLPRLILGVNREISISKDFSVLPELDLVMTFDGKRNTVIKTSSLSIEPRFGLELGYKSKVFIRSGIGEFQTIKDFDNSTYLSKKINFGLGIALNKVNIDYALTDLANQAEGLYSHVFSLNFGINKSE